MDVRLSALGIALVCSTLFLACGDENRPSSPMPTATPPTPVATACGLMTTNGVCLCGLTMQGVCVGTCGGTGQCANLGPQSCGCKVD